MSINIFRRARFGGLLAPAFAALLLLSTFSLAEVPADTVVVDSAKVDTAKVESVVADSSSHPVRDFFAGAFNNVVQPVLNAIVYPIAQPLH